MFKLQIVRFVESPLIWSTLPTALKLRLDIYYDLIIIEVLNYNLTVFYNIIFLYDTGQQNTNKFTLVW